MQDTALDGQEDGILDSVKSSRIEACVSARSRHVLSRLPHHLHL
jgi:hypothetical protein